MHIIFVSLELRPDCGFTKKLDFNRHWLLLLTKGNCQREPNDKTIYEHMKKRKDNFHVTLKMFSTPKGSTINEHVHLV